MQETLLTTRAEPEPLSSLRIKNKKIKKFYFYLAAQLHERVRTQPASPAHRCALLPISPGRCSPLEEVLPEPAEQAPLSHPKLAQVISNPTLRTAGRKSSQEHLQSFLQEPGPKWSPREVDPLIELRAGCC